MSKPCTNGPPSEVGPAGAPPGTCSRPAPGRTRRRPPAQPPAAEQKGRAAQGKRRIGVLRAGPGRVDGSSRLRHAASRSSKLACSSSTGSRALPSPPSPPQAAAAATEGVRAPAGGRRCRRRACRAWPGARCASACGRRAAAPCRLLDEGAEATAGCSVFGALWAAAAPGSSHCPAGRHAHCPLPLPTIPDAANPCRPVLRQASPGRTMV